MPANDLVSGRLASVSNLPGLVAFWSFEDGAGRDVVSRHDPRLHMDALPFLLAQVGDDEAYPISRWPHPTGKARLEFPAGGPFGRSIRLNQGHLYGLVPRHLFDGGLLDMGHRRPFTLVAWLRFFGERHLVGGIWDEGGWDRYGGRRQAALFGGLFDQSGTIAHVSATGAACYPQSDAEGAQYARTRAIDGAEIAQNQWVSMAMTFDPATSRVTAYTDGVASPQWLTDPVMADVLRVPKGALSNPISFPDDVFDGRAVLLKFSGFDYRSGLVREHRLAVDFLSGTLEYQQVGDDVDPRYRVRGRVVGGGDSAFLVDPAQAVAHFEPSPRDGVVAELECQSGEGWRRAADPLTYQVVPGAPFTFGRAPGVGDHGPDFGSQIDLAGFAVFGRVLSGDELGAIAFSPDEGRG